MQVNIFNIILINKITELETNHVSWLCNE